jgi:hypothetical protein
MKPERSHTATVAQSSRRLPAWNLLKLAGGFATVFALVSILSGIWRAVAYSVVALFVFLVALAVYFWGAIVFGGFLETAWRRRTPVPWELSGTAGDVPAYDLDPGLELLAAGMLVYRTGEVKPHVAFRSVPLAGMRAIRPFIVARTGAARTYHFDFALSDERDRTRFAHAFAHDLASVPRLVMPAAHLTVQQPGALDGSQWSVQVRTGVTVVTVFRFSFVNGTHSAPDQFGSRMNELIKRLLDEAIKHDAVSDVQTVVLEESEL